MGPQGWGRKGGPQGRPNPLPAGEAKASEVMGPRTAGSFKALRSAESPSPTELRLSVSLLSFLLQEGGRSPDLGTDSLPLPSSRRALHSLISGSCCSVALSPFRFQAKYWYSLPTSPPLLCPWGPSSRQPWLNPPSIKTRPLLPSLPEELLTDVLTYFGRLDFLIPRIWGWEGP